VDLGGEVGEEHVALAVAAHQRHALAGQGLLDEPADAARALVLEVDLALVGDHGALAGHHLAVQGDPEHPWVLQGEGVVRAGLEVLAEQVAAHPHHLLARERTGALVPEAGGDVQHPRPCSVPLRTRRRGPRFGL
jgi:hypothetical protein